MKLDMASINFRSSNGGLKWQSLSSQANVKVSGWNAQKINCRLTVDLWRKYFKLFILNLSK